MAFWMGRKGRKQAPARKSASSSESTMLADSVRLGSLLSEDLVVWLPEGKTKEQLIALLIERLCRARKLGDPARYLGKVIEREQGMSTTNDTGLSIPHARVEDIDSIKAVLGLLPVGLPDPKQPDTQIRAMCVFFSPLRQEAFQQHLLLLRSVSALFQPGFIDDLLSRKTPAEVLKLIHAREQG
jgi:PTS system nitrogen regulatory IIA component